MVLYGVENHYSLTGDSDVTHLFDTEKNAMDYFLRKFDENSTDDGLVWDGDQYISRETAEKCREFYYDNDSTIDHYRIVKYEI